MSMGNTTDSMLRSMDLDDQRREQGTAGIGTAGRAGLGRSGVHHAARFSLRCGSNRGAVEQDRLALQGGLRPANDIGLGLIV
jgi:hypothetical protein